MVALGTRYLRRNMTIEERAAEAYAEEQADGKCGLTASRAQFAASVAMTALRPEQNKNGVLICITMRGPPQKVWISATKDRSIVFVVANGS